MRIQLSALFGVLAFVASSLPLSAIPLSWAQGHTCTQRGQTWELPHLWKASAPDLASSMLGRLASPTSQWRFADQTLTRVSHSPISGIALHAAFEASNDFVVTGPGLAHPLYAWGGCNRGFTVMAGAFPILPPTLAPTLTLDTGGPMRRSSGSRPQVPTSFPGLGPSAGGASVPLTTSATPSDPPYTLVMDVDDKREPPDPGTPITIVLDPNPNPAPALTPVPLPNSLAPMACALCLLFGWSRRKA